MLKTSEADLQVWCDASKDGLAFWVPQLSSGFGGDTVVNDNTSFNIFLNEATTILAALHWSASFHPTPS